MHNSCWCFLYIPVLLKTWNWIRMIDCFINEIVLSMDSFYGALKWKHNHVCKHAKSNKSMCVVLCVAVQRHNKEPNLFVDCKEDWISFLPSICHTHTLILVFIKCDGPSYQIWRWGNSKCSSITLVTIVVFNLREGATMYVLWVDLIE